MDKHSLATLLIVILLGAASAAVTTNSLLSSKSKALVASERMPDAHLLAQLETLRAQNRDLSDRIAVLELRPQVSERAPAMDPSFEEEVRTWMENAGTGDPSRGALELEVAEALHTIRDQEELEEQQIKLARRDEWITDTVEKVAPELGLNEYQTRAMRNAWVAKADADAELGRLWTSGENRESIGEIKRLNEEQHQTTLQGFLAPQQYEAYTEMVRSWRRGDK